MDAEVGADRQERKNQEVVPGCSERGHEVTWFEGRRGRGRS